MGLQLVDESCSAPDAAAADDQELQLLRYALETALPPRQRHIIVDRYGIGRQEPRAVTDIAKGMKLSRERVRQLEKESLQLLRDACARGVRASDRRARASSAS